MKRGSGIISHDDLKNYSSIYRTPITGSFHEYEILSMGYKEDAFMTKLDPKGNIIWTYPYGSTDEDDWGWSVFETPKSNIVFVGSTKSFGASLFDIYLVGTNSDGILK